MHWTVERARRIVFVALVVAFLPGPAGVARVLADPLLIEHVTVIDGTGRAPALNMSVLVVDGRIEKLEKGPLDVAASTTRIDAKGKFLIPGLIDTHIHLVGGYRGAPGTARVSTVDKESGRRALHGYLYSGVTSVFDAGNNPDFIFAMREDERAGRMVSPRIFAAGQVVAPANGYPSGAGAITISGYAEGVAQLDQLFSRSPDVVKFSRDGRGIAFEPKQLPLLPIDVMEGLIAYCHERGFRTTVHAVDEKAASDSIGAGIDALAHPLFSSVATDDFVEQVVSKKIPVVTTLAVIRNISRVVHDPGFFDEGLFQSTLTRGDLDFHAVSERARYMTSNMYKWADGVWPNIAATVRKLYDAGGILALGSDRTIGAMTQQELEYLVELGIPAIDVIRIATLNGAIYLGRASDLGSIEVGKLADMVLLNADPSVDIRNIKSIDAVFKSGRPVDLASLDLPVNASKQGGRTEGRDSRVQSGP
jgi:imidazolonepropionase-like amidohydrolase